ncbi:hypothetical protein [Kitasatospora sp. NPDC094016]|uniref:hypothetical protein n=1 Tax=Kitasatospora sp. NPDC094016 TaxID=3154986 RepID=UPI00331E3E9E
MARGTAHQVEPLRAEVGTALQAGLEEIRNHTDSLRAELTATVATGLSEHRDEFFEAIARGQQETSRAHQDNRSLHRQLQPAQRTRRSAEQRPYLPGRRPRRGAPAHRRLPRGREPAGGSRSSAQRWCQQQLARHQLTHRDDSGPASADSTQARFRCPTTLGNKTAGHGLIGINSYTNDRTSPTACPTPGTGRTDSLHQ